jgi:hypothetical protein
MNAGAFPKRLKCCVDRLKPPLIGRGKGHCRSFDGVPKVRLRLIREDSAMSGVRLLTVFLQAVDPQAFRTLDLCLGEFSKGRMRGEVRGTEQTD